MRLCVSKSALAQMVGMMLVLLIIQTSWSADFERRDVTFKSQGLNCAGWYYVPKGLKPGEKRPVIVMAHGFSLMKEMGLQKFAESFAHAGFVVLAFDFRYLGASEGEPRGQIIYYEQHQDFRNAITWASLQQEADPERIGMWGFSFSGSHVLYVSAFDKRVKAAVAQAPGTSTWEMRNRSAKPEDLAVRSAKYAKHMMEEYATGKVNYIPVVENGGQRALLRQKAAYEWFTDAAKDAPNWKNQVTQQSIFMNREYAPAAYIHLISPTPLLMIISRDDIFGPTEDQKQVFERAKEPKQLLVLKGGHFDTFQGDGFTKAAATAVEWFKQYLKP